MRNILPPLKTCEAALAEAMHLFESRTNSVQALLRMLERRILEVEFSVSPHLTEILALLDRYDNVPMSLADACLVRMCELDQRTILLTTDHDFLIYRMNGRDRLPLIMP